MKKLILTSSSFLIMSGLAYAGGEILPIVTEAEEMVPYVSPPVAVVTPAPIPKSIPLIQDISPLGLYVGLGLTAARYDPNCVCVPKGNVDKTVGFIGRVGYDFNQFFGVEARAIRTKWSSEGGDLGHYGVFLKPMYPVSSDVNVYALAGYAKTETAGGMRRKTNTEALAWGLGLEYDLGTDTPKEGRYARTFDGYGDQESGWGLFTDYERLVQKSGSPDFDTLNFGVTYDF